MLFSQSSDISSTAINDMRYGIITLFLPDKRTIYFHVNNF